MRSGFKRTKSFRTSAGCILCPFFLSFIHIYIHMYCIRKKPWPYTPRIIIYWINVWKKIRPSGIWTHVLPHTSRVWYPDYVIMTTMLATQQSKMWFTRYGTWSPGKFSSKEAKAGKPITLFWKPTKDHVTWYTTEINLADDNGGSTRDTG